MPQIVPASPLGEGLIGTAFQALRTLREGDTKTNRHFRYVPDTIDGDLHAFLTVPIIRGLRPLGMLVIQDPQIDRFDESDTRALRAISSQLASTIENANLLLRLTPPQHSIEQAPSGPEACTRFSGWPVQGTMVSGNLLIFGDSELERLSTTDDQPGMHEDFEQAALDTELQLQELQRKIADEDPDIAVLIFGAHLLMLKDEGFAGEIRRRIGSGTAARIAVTQVVNEYLNLFSEMEAPHLREKSRDVKDLGLRLLRNLRQHRDEDPDHSNRVVVSASLLPSDVLKLAAQRVAGLVLVGAGINSHITLIARSLGLPTLLVEDPTVLSVSEGTPVLLDAERGSLIVHPNEHDKARYRTTRTQAASAPVHGGPAATSAHTRDGERIHLLANINLLSELRSARRLGAEGVGLYRTELPFLMRNDFPSEEEQYRIYRSVLESMSGRPVTFRTLDVGGDKLLSYFPSSNREENPFLGLRAIRFSLRHQEVFRRQIRALLRSGIGAELKILFPLISSLDDFRLAREIVGECAAQLQAEDMPHNGSPKLGAMLELPSIVEVIDDLAREAAFLSIGSNDLIQHQLAVDRSNPSVADMYLSHHPAVLRVLERIAIAARRHAVELTLCGEMASDARMLPFLIGIGLRRISVDPERLPDIRHRLAEIDARDARALAAELLRLPTIREVEAHLAGASPAAASG